MGRSTAISEKPQTRRAPWQSFRSLLGRLQDPKDVQAAMFMIFAILVVEAAICPLIIAKIPCEPPCCRKCSKQYRARFRMQACPAKACCPGRGGA